MSNLCLKCALCFFEFRVDCDWCSTPPYSALNGILTTDLLKDKYGINVIG